MHSYYHPEEGQTEGAYFGGPRGPVELLIQPFCSEAGEVEAGINAQYQRNDRGDFDDEAFSKAVEHGPRQPNAQDSIDGSYLIPLHAAK